jgi:hypothetical protein
MASNVLPQHWVVFMTKARLLQLSCLFLTVATAAWGQNVARVPGQFDGSQRLGWFARSSFGVNAQASSLVMAGISTWRNIPHDYGPHWEGFADRYGVRIADRTATNGLEAGFGYFWGEDPRYFRVPEKPLGDRMWNTIKMVGVTHNRSGDEMPAYARFIAMPGAVFLSNAYRPDSENKTNDALGRLGTSIGTRFLHNVAVEFWPDVKQRMFRHGGNKGSDADITGEVR